MDEQQAGRVRMCNSIKFETKWNVAPILKIVAHTACSCCITKTIVKSRGRLSVYQFELKK